MKAGVIFSILPKKCGTGWRSEAQTESCLRAPGGVGNSLEVGTGPGHQGGIVGDVVSFLKLQTEWWCAGTAHWTWTTGRQELSSLVEEAMATGSGLQSPILVEETPEHVVT